MKVACDYRTPMCANGMGIVDWKELDAEVLNDIAVAQLPVAGK